MTGTRRARIGALEVGLLLLVVVSAVRLLTGERADRPALEVDYDGVDTTAPDMAWLADSVWINKASPSRLRKAGFSYYHVSQILYLRSRGFCFSTTDEILGLPHADTALVTGLAPRISFARPDQSATVTDLAYLVGQQFERRRYAPLATYPSHTKDFSPRIPLFAADSLTLAEAGITAAAWDTLRHYQRGFVLRGSMTLDSLVALAPSSLADVLRANSSPRGGFARREAEKSEEMVAQIAKVELNGATVEQLVGVPGIGQKTAEAIVELRRRLGGFVAREQLREVWYLAEGDRYDRVVGFVTVDSMSVVRVNVNAANDTRMRRHPYFPSVVVARMGQVRLQNGGRKLSRRDVERCVSGVELSPYFWSYVEY